MTKRVVNLRSGRPLLDVASYGRSGPSRRSALTSAEIAHASRTARGVPEVMIKVSGGAGTMRGVGAHLDYIGREGDGEIETDEGTVLHEKGFERALLDDWALELEARHRHTQRAIAAGRKPPKLVHNLVFSMPKGTPPEKLRLAVRLFASEEFGLQHRYVMALHTDQGHPHVHVVVKAVSEEGERLNIRKATLREWRRDFAQYLREHGVEANATERAVRGAMKTTKKDGIHRAVLRGESTHYRERLENVAQELARGQLSIEHGKAKIVETRKAVVAGWGGLAEALDREGQSATADIVRSFARSMAPPQTEKEHLAHRLTELVAQRREREPELTR